MVATRLLIGIAYWLIMCSPSQAALADQTDTPPLFDNLGSLHHPITACGSCWIAASNDRIASSWLKAYTSRSP